MTNQFDQLLADFSDGASDVIDALVASTTGVRAPSLSVRGDGQQARQANAGSLVRLTDGTYHVIAFTNGVQVRDARDIGAEILPSRTRGVLSACATPDDAGRLVAAIGVIPAAAAIRGPPPANPGPTPPALRLLPAPPGPPQPGAISFAPRFELHASRTHKIPPKSKSNNQNGQKNQRIKYTLPSHLSHPTPKWNQNNQNPGMREHPGKSETL